MYQVDSAWYTKLFVLKDVVCQVLIAWYAKLILHHFIESSLVYQVDSAWYTKLFVL